MFAWLERGGVGRWTAAERAPRITDHPTPCLVCVSCAAVQASLEPVVEKRLITMAALIASGGEEIDKDEGGKRVASMYT